MEKGVSQTAYAKILGLSKEAVSKAIREGRIKKGWDTKNKLIKVEVANKEWGFLHIDTNVTEILGEKEKANKDSEIKLTKSTSFAEARRINEIVRGQIQILEYQEQKKELVRKDEVNRQLGAFAIELRNALLAIPDRISADVFASKNELEVNNLITTAIRTAMDYAIERQIIE